MANSETIMLSIKFLMFYALEFVVVVLVGATVIAGLYQLIRDKVSDLRPVTPAMDEKATIHS